MNEAESAESSTTLRVLIDQLCASMSVRTSEKLKKKGQKIAAREEDMVDLANAVKELIS
jgi:hypothetical protein